MYAISIYNLPKVSLWIARVCLLTGRRAQTDGRTDGRVFTVLASLQRFSAVGGPGSAERWAGLADLTEDWPAACSCDAAAMITREHETTIENRTSLINYWGISEFGYCRLSTSSPARLGFDAYGQIIRTSTRDTRVFIHIYT